MPRFVPERKILKRVVFDDSPYFDGFDGEEGVLFGQASILLEGMLAEVPAEFRASARLRIRSIEGYDGAETNLEFFYYSPETDEELAERLELERQAAEEERRKERQLLANLKAKYGD